MGHGQPLIGREELTARLGALLGRSRERGRMIGLLGEAGVGKSALQAAVVEEAAAGGFTVLAARGSESETHLPFASLHQVLRPLLPHASQLPARQRDALLSGFGMGDVLAPDPFLLSLAALELVSEAARHAPVLVSLDDLQWMDEPSVDVFAFLARRIDPEPVLILASARTGSASISPATAGDGAIEWLEVPDLDPASAEALIAAHAPGLAPDLRERVLREAAGNPLALLEFPVAMASGRFGWTELSDDLPMTTRLERAFASRVQDLPGPTRTLLGAAALDDGSELAEVLAATGVLLGRTVGPEAGRPAFEAGLLLSDGTDVRFRHPLVGSALRRTMPADERRSVHAALAEALTAAHPDRAAWHRAAATGAPDEDVAAALATAAGNVARRGALGSAVTWLRRAAALTPDPATRGSRLLSGAEFAFELGRSSEVEQTRRQLGGITLHPRDRSRLIWLEGAFDDGSSAGAAEVRRLIGLARERLHDDDPDLALQLLLGAARRAWWGDPGEDVRRELVRAARAAATPEQDPRLLAVLALTDANEHAPAVVRGLGRWTPDAGGQPELAALLGIAAFCIGDFTHALAALSLPAAELRAQGRLSVLAEVLTLQSWSALYSGDFARARGADEAMRLSDHTGRSLWAAAARPAIALVDAVRSSPGDPGLDAPDAGLLAEAERVGLGAASPMSTVLASVQFARGVQELAAARPQQAHQQLQRAFDPADPAHHPVQQVWMLGYLAEAAVATGRQVQAREVVAGIERLTGPGPAPAARIALEYARAVLADEANADASFREALAGAARTHPWHRARLELAHGSWLRRRRRSVDARPRLRSARDTFAGLGTPIWAERAELELRAAGERAPHPATRPLLSPQEAEVAHLAAQGLSNREIAQRLYLSHRTVGSHLYRIFPKLGVTSRGQLSSVLGAE